jgi:hypothetical protein
VKEKLIPDLQLNSVIVLANGAFHTALLQKSPSSRSTKNKRQNGWQKDVFLLPEMFIAAIYLSIYLSIYLWLYSPFVGPWSLFQFLNPTDSR